MCFGRWDEWHVDLEKIITLEKLGSYLSCPASRKKAKSTCHSSMGPARATLQQPLDSCAALTVTPQKVPVPTPNRALPHGELQVAPCFSLMHSDIGHKTANSDSWAFACRRSGVV
jgi:hypothetical protein